MALPVATDLLGHIVQVREQRVMHRDRKRVTRTFWRRWRARRSVAGRLQGTAMPRARRLAAHPASTPIIVQVTRLRSLGADLALLYEVEPRALMQAVKRNSERFPEDFMFQLSRDEWLNLKSHFVISSWGGSRTPPYAFTEQGVAMLSSVLKSPRAVSANIEIMRTFIRLRRILAESADLSRRLDELEQHYDEQFKAVFDALRQLMAPPQKPGRPIGFIQDRDTP